MTTIDYEDLSTSNTEFAHLAPVVRESASLSESERLNNILRALHK